jgi:hypothetical protein
LLACEVCNRPSKVGDKKIGKHNRFPVIGKHANCPEEVIQEQPLLINPASGYQEDDPYQHLRIDLETGLLIPLTERGAMCIEVFGLNLRQNLVDARREACLLAEAFIEKLKPSNSRSQKDNAIAEIQKILQGKKPYSSVQIKVISEYLSNLNQATKK